MTGEEARIALKTGQKIRFAGVTYDYAQAWRVSVEHQHGNFIQSLELVKNNTVVQARIEDCELTDECAGITKRLAQDHIYAAEEMK